MQKTFKRTLSMFLAALLCFGACGVGFISVWAVGPYTVCYNYAVNTGLPDGQRYVDYEPGANVALVSERATKVGGWDFVGWNTNATAKVALAEPYPMPAEDLTLYAIFSKRMICSFIDYNGTAKRTTPLDAFLWNKDTMAAFTTPVQGYYTGWERCGWAYHTNAKAPDSSVFASGANLSVNDGANPKHYGLYSRDVTLSYDLGGASGTKPGDQIGKQYVNSYDISITSRPAFSLAAAPVWAGYTFQGWKVNDVIYAPGASVTVPGDATATAQWVAGTGTQHFVSYNISETGGSSVEYGSASYAENEIVSFPAAVKPNYKHIGWNTDKSAHDGLDSYAMGSEDVILYSVFRKDVELVWIDFAEDVRQSNATSATIFNAEPKSTTYYIPAINAITGWSAVGWEQTSNMALLPMNASFMQPGLSGTFEAGTTVSSATYYALYSRTVTLSYNEDDGDSRPADATATQYFCDGKYKNPRVMIANVITKPTFLFGGWMDDSGAVYQAGDYIDMAEDMILTAVWIPDPDAPHTHTYGSWVVIAPSTHTVQGTEEGTCACGDTTTRPIPVTAEHTYGNWVTVTQPTHTTKGLEKTACACGDEITQPIPETAEHTYGSWIVINPPTHTAQGLEKATCICSDEITRPILVTPGHTYGNWVVITPPTHTVQGIEEATCACGDTTTRPIPVTPGHTYGSWVVITPPTHTVQGIEEATCVCGDTTTRPIPVTPGHTYGNWVVITPPTHTVQGTEKATCVCGDEITRPIPELGATLTILPKDGTSDQTITMKSGDSHLLTRPNRPSEFILVWQHVSGSGTLNGNTFTIGAGDATVSAVWSLYDPVTGLRIDNLTDDFDSFTGMTVTKDANWKPSTPGDFFDSGTINNNRETFLYDVTLRDNNGPYIKQFTDLVQVSLPLPSNYDPDPNSGWVYEFGYYEPDAITGGAPYKLHLFTPVTNTNVPAEKTYYIDMVNKRVIFWTDHFSTYGFIRTAVGLDDETGGPTATPLKCWQKLPAWLQWILRWLCFGWIWMK